MTTTITIDQLEDKTARNIASYWLQWDIDPYHMTILLAALFLAKSGWGRLEYRTQWSKGGTLWVDTDATVVVPCLLPKEYTYEFETDTMTFGEGVEV